MNEALKPCPFCGGEAYAAKDDYEKVIIGCLKCNLYFGIEIENGCELYDGWRATFPDKEIAIEAWNTRMDINPEKNCKESEDWCADCGHIEMCRWYPTMGCCFKETTEELFDKHWEECRQIALYDDELKKALALLRRVRAVHAAAIRNGDAAVSALTSRLLYDIDKLEGEI